MRGKECKVLLFDDNDLLDAEYLLKRQKLDRIHRDMENKAEDKTKKVITPQFIPKENQIYYFDDYNKMGKKVFKNDKIDIQRLQKGNCFRNPFEYQQRKKFKTFLVEEAKPKEVSTYVKTFAQKIYAEPIEPSYDEKKYEYALELYEKLKDNKVSKQDIETVLSAMQITERQIIEYRKQKQIH